MKIVADENIPFVEEGFGQLGKVVTAPGRAITKEMLRDAELLVVRSVTKVNSALLDGTSVRFVGTCTIGTDHIDLPCLAKRGVTFSAAPGSNANSVAEYIVSVILILGGRMGFRAAEKSLGVVGVGNVGSKVARKAEAMGMRVLRNDPPLARKTGDKVYRPIDELLRECDIITLHVPLTRTGDDATHHLADALFIERMMPGAMLFNSSRGEVHDTAAVLAAKKSGKLSALFLDVWEGEPAVDAELLKGSDLASPHICGYSADGKIAGVTMVYKAACAMLGVTANWNPSRHVPPPEHATLTVDRVGAHPDDVLRELALLTYDIREDDARMRKMLDLPPADRPKYFDRLRKEYPVRREFFNVSIDLAECCRGLKPMVSGVGFAVI